MFEWIKKLFSKKPKVFEIHDTVKIEVEVKTKTNNRYNIRDEKGRFTRKENKNGRK